MTGRFVNPYSFVPLPGTVLRRAPTMHRGQPPTGDAAALLSGSIRVRWTLATPMLLAAAYDKEGWVDSTGSLRVPGSSLRGATRSLHETLFCGCLRIIDEGFVPSYRMPASAGADPDWVPARVATSKDGKAQSVQLCSSHAWVDARELRRRWPAGSIPTSGDLVDVDGTEFESPLGRLEIREVHRVEVLSRAEDRQGTVPPTEHGQILLVTDTAARKQTRVDDKSVCDAYWMLGTLDDADPVPVTEAAREDFTRTCAGTDDRRRLEQGRRAVQADATWRTRTTYADVHWWDPDGRGKPVVGRRAMASGSVFPGDAVWVKLNADHEVEGIRLAQIWRRRHPNALTVGQRLGARTETSPHPCRPEVDNPQLCLSCATFGAVDADGDRRGRGEQTAYRGHVRFSAAVSTEPVRLIHVDLSPMGTPNPGSGMFYLRLPGTLPERPLGDVATQWGSAADSPAAPINGRKYYWHSDPDRQAAHWTGDLGRKVQPRYEATAEQRSSKMSRPGVLAPAGTVLEATVTFDRLDDTALRALVAALDPTPLLRFATASDTAEHAVHLGGGKPLGLGSAKPEIAHLHVQRLGERYLGADATATAATDWRQIGRQEAIGLVQRVGHFLGTLRTVSRLLDTKALGEWEPFVSYPPGDEWTGLTGPDFRRSFGFFLAANGEVLRGGTRPWRLLPGAGASDPSLPIELRRRGGGAR